MAWLLGVGDALAGAGLYVLFVTTLTFGSFFALMWTRSQTSWAAALLAVLFVPLPIPALSDARLEGRSVRNRRDRGFRVLKPRRGALGNRVFVRFARRLVLLAVLATLARQNS